jgi:Trp operon repressor
VDDLSSRMKDSNGKGAKAISWRRAKVLELTSQDNSQVEIAKALQVGEATISRDLSYLRQQANENLKTHIQGKLPEEYQNKRMILLDDSW